MKKLDFIHQRIILATTVAVVGFLSIAVIITAIRRNTDAVLVFADEFMIATANPKATKAGYQVLKDGGTAMDAIITAQMVLNVVEPQSSGIGGGAFLLYWDAQERRLRAYDGRETAPIDATPKLFLDEDGKPMDFAKALIGGRAVGTPGLLRMLELGHRNHGGLDWEVLFGPAIRVARDGFELSEYLAKEIAKVQAKHGGLEIDEDTRAQYLTPSGLPKPLGARMINPALAQSLELIAKNGADVFYNGPIRDDIVREVREAVNPGFLRPEDFSIYTAKERDPLCVDYREFRVCSMPPPTSGGVTLLQILKLVERFDLSSQGYSATGVHLFSEASKLAFADRNRYLGDSDFVPVAIEGLLDKDYLESRSRLIDPKRSLKNIVPGEPPASNFLKWADHISQSKSGTSHMVAVDAHGNVASITSTIESRFGSRLTVRGFLLNNELTDFSFEPKVEGRRVANSVQPGKRPRSSMTPVIVFDRYSGDPVLAIGSPGGSRIINYVAKAIIAIFDWQMDIDTAIHTGNFVSRKEPLELERDTQTALFKHDLELLGHAVKERELKSGLNAIMIRPGASSGRLVGSADRRREGFVMGD